MKLLKLFKKRKKDLQVEGKHSSVKLNLSQILSFLQDKIKDNEAKEKEIISQAKDKINDFNDNLENKLDVLMNFNLEKRKIEERIKNIVSESRSQYVDTVRGIMRNLESVQEERLSKFIEKIDNIFLNFYKSSFKNYERANFLIGKELVNIKEAFKIFSQDLVRLFEDKKEIPKLFKKIDSIKSKLDSLVLNEKNINEIEKEINSFDKEIVEREREKVKLSKEIDKVKKSENYQKMLESKNKVVKLDSNIKEDVFALKRLIDFKSLISFFHVNLEQMNVVKEYRDNFYDKFVQDKGKEIINFLKEAKLNSEAISKKINLIKDKFEMKKENEKNIGKDLIWELEFKIKDLERDMENLKKEKYKEEKKSEKIKESKDLLIEDIKKQLLEIGGELKL
jgi:hypothetical protein